MTAAWLGGANMIGVDTLWLFLIGLPALALGTWFGMAGYAVNETAKGVLFVLLAAVTTMVLVQDDVVLRLWRRLTLLPGLRWPRAPRPPGSSAPR